MSAAGGRKARERFRYHTGCLAPKQYIARCKKRIATAADRIAQIEADLAEAQGKAAAAIAAVKADAHDAKLDLERMEFMLDEQGRYVGARLPEMLRKFGLGTEHFAASSSRRPRGRPRKDGQLPQPRSEQVRAEARRRRSSKIRTDVVPRSPAHALQRKIHSSNVCSTDQRVVADSNFQATDDRTPQVREVENGTVCGEAATNASTYPQGDAEFAPAALAKSAPQPLPLVLPSLDRQLQHLLDGVGGRDMPVEVLTVADKVIEVFSPEADAERARSRDLGRWPSNYDPAWADAWDPDPRSPLPIARGGPMVLAIRTGAEKDKLWPIAIARRDFIKQLMERVALGELTFEPDSTSEQDRARSVRWLVFRKADHDWLFDLSRREIELYTRCLLDVTSWPPGLSRAELLHTFGCGQACSVIPNMSSFGRPPPWLVPDDSWIYAEKFGLRHAPGMDPAYKDRPPLKRELNSTIPPHTTTGRRLRELSATSSSPDPFLLRLAASYQQTQKGNRLLDLPPDARTGYISFALQADIVRASLASGETMPLGEAHLQAREDWCEKTPTLLHRDAILGRAGRLYGLANQTMEDTGLSALTLVYGIAFYEQGDHKYAAPLSLCSAKLTENEGGYLLRRTDVPEWNEDLLAVLGLSQTDLPVDPLAWDDIDYRALGIAAILPVAILGTFDLARHRHRSRIDPRQDSALTNHLQVRRLIEGETDTVWPQQNWSTIATPTLMTASLDRSQADVVDASREGLSFVVEGGPGTGKTQTIIHILTNAAVDGRSVLFISGRPIALRSALMRLGSVAECCLRLFDEDCDPDGVAASCGVEPGTSVRATLERLDVNVHPSIVMATPATYVTHVPPSWGFDLLVVDEASLIPLAAALPAVAACTQIIICGDPNQMQRDPPPWVMFDRDRPYVQPVTLVDAAISAGMPRATLTHHYRSAHPRLMHSTNRISYGGRMWMCPSPASDNTLGFFAASVDGIYDPKTATNPIEADAIVTDILRHKEAGGKASIGVIVMTQQQRDLIRRRVAELGLDTEQYPGEEDLLIADYNGVQGEERDIIFIGMTFGRRQGEDAWPMSFGPVSMPGGEKRLTVIMTRARQRMTLFTSFPKEAIDPARCLGHANLYAYMVTAERTYCDDPVRWINGLISTEIGGTYDIYLLGNAYGFRRSTNQNYDAALYITGRTDELTEKSEIKQYTKSGWIVVEATRSEFEEAHRKISLAAELNGRVKRKVYWARHGKNIS